ncbi:insertion sequence element ISSfl2 transposase [Longimycelium tulufanense]|uniref:Insertion sequence element ISSfl2 transposase n=1 Tax=Longimycelium tulufanense TaxID=907463 RepID=A0A8J3CEX7_9PSEU|nr:insertion sequence element ISSfl2 transposase [Longimycelium tulufanense]
MTSKYGVFLGLDVGRGDHHALGLDPQGKRLYDAPLPNSEPTLRELFGTLAAHGRVLVVVDQPATIGALPVAVARSCGHDVAYLPGLAMRRIADLYPGTAKTDARDAFVIADAARTLPHALCRVDVGDEALAELEVLVGFDDDLAAEATRLTNRIRGLLTGIHPALERVLGPKITHPAVLEILSRCGGPAGITKAGRRKLRSIAAAHAPRMGERLVENILAALTEQTVVVPGTTAANTVLPRLAYSLKTVLQQRKTVADEVGGDPRCTPSCPGSAGPDVDARHRGQDRRPHPARSRRRLRLHLLRPPRGLRRHRPRSGTSIRGEHPARSGNRKLKRAFFLAAFAALADPTSRAYYQRKRDEGKETQRRVDLPGPPPLRRHLRHAPRRSPLPGGRHPSRGLTTL